MKRWLFQMAVVAVAVLAWSGAAGAADKVGVVLMHGKKGTAEHVQTLATDLIGAGYLVLTPDMPWSQSRAYERTLEEAHTEIDAWVADLRADGATRIVVAGHSMGANMAMGYAATHSGVHAVLALGPGQTADTPNFRSRVKDSVALARTMVASGRGDAAAAFEDLHLGKLSTVTATARVYASYFDPEGLAAIASVAPRIGVPVLWTVGTADRNLMDLGRAYAFDRLPAHRHNVYAEVASDHMGTPDASRTVVLGWLRQVFGEPGQGS
ncbi:alpha/beta fold hydrolase [Azospirillum sp.]|uniref:alpha/beta fold hydrolase n=1 Tax=Azospirillum sp. TaxID=34012 RepID=UPI002D627D5A|nr:alpha/beta fold hydrolase [Azospirillum sp.]HYD63996.1 alpha/beta fold hydrolase [Azospirillum sp.]